MQFAENQKKSKHQSIYENDLKNWKCFGADCVFCVQQAWTWRFRNIWNLKYGLQLISKKYMQYFERLGTSMVTGKLFKKFFGFLCEHTQIQAELTMVIELLYRRGKATKTSQSLSKHNI